MKTDDYKKLIYELFEKHKLDRPKIKKQPNFSSNKILEATTTFFVYSHIFAGDYIYINANTAEWLSNLDKQLSTEVNKLTTKGD